MCVLIADRQCSAAEFFARASDVCRLSKRLASLIDEGLMVLEVDGHTVNSADAAVLKFASVTRLRRTGLWGRHLAFRRHGASAGVMPDRNSPTASLASLATSSDGLSTQSFGNLPVPFDEESFETEEHFTVLVHSIGLSPSVLTIPLTATATAVADLAVEAAGPCLSELRSASYSWRPCTVTPVGGHILHSILIAGDPAADNECHIVLDLRALSSGGLDFHAAVFPVMLSTELVFRLITNLAGGQRPAAVYNGAAPIEGYFCRLHDGDILKPVLAVEGGPLPVPAVWQSAQCIRMLPGLTVNLVSHASVRDFVVPAISAGACPPSNAISTSTTTTRGFQTTTSTSPAVRPFRPLYGLQSQDVVFHIMGRNGAVAHASPLRPTLVLRSPPPVFIGPSSCACL